MKILTVSELTLSIKALLEQNFRLVSIRGEVSNLKVQSSGHLYFSLKDSSAQISAVLFRGSASQLSKMPKEGDQVVATGEVGLYPPRGQYQLIVRTLEFAGVGELLLKLQERKQRLEALGWFAPERKKALPKFPKTIGVVTSPTGAVIQDILHVLKRRFAGFHLILAPVKVQGEGAAEEIAAAIGEFNRQQAADLLIVGRGGGSIEDLWAFNEEIVLKAIFESNIPIISAVGHETDVTLADFVADVRAPTPSAAAEIATMEKASLLKFLFETKRSIEKVLQDQIDRGFERLKAILTHPLFSSPYGLLAEPIQKCDRIRSDIAKEMRRGLEQRRQLLQNAKAKLQALSPLFQLQETKKRLLPYPTRLLHALKGVIEQRKGQLNGAKEALRLLNPQTLLDKGYALSFDPQTKALLSSSRDFAPNQSFDLVLRDGRVLATVQSVEKTL